MKISHFGHAFSRLVALASCVWAVSVPAQTWIGNGTNDLWSTAENWLPPGVPRNDGSGNVTFSGTLRLSPVADLPWSVRSLYFDATAGAFVVGGSPLALFAGGVVNNSANPQTINNALSLRAAQFWNAAAGALVFNGEVATEGHTLSFAGNHPILLRGVVGGFGALVKRGAGPLSLSGANAFSGGFVLESGTLVLGHDAALGTGTFAVGAAIVRGTGAPRVFANPVVMGLTADPIFDSRFDLTFAGPTVLAGNRVLRVENTGVVTLAGILGQAAMETSLTKIGEGTLVLGGPAANSLLGPVAALGGELRLDKTPGVNAVVGGLAVGGGSVPAAARLQGSHQIADAAGVSVSKSGLFDLNGHSDTVRALHLSGGEVATGGGVLRIAEGITSMPSDAPARISGQLDLAQATQGFSVQNGVAEPDLVASANIANGGVLKTGTGTLVLGGSNTFAGGLTVGFGTVGLAHDHAAGNGWILMGDGKLRAENEARLLPNPVLSGMAFGVGDATFSGTNDLVFTGPAFLGGLPTWTVENLGRTEFWGPVGEDQPGRGLTKVGSGLLAFGGAQANTYSGLTAVRAGVLELFKAPGVNAIAGGLEIGSEDGVLGEAVVRLGAAEQIADASRIRVRRTGVLDLGGQVESGTLLLAGGQVVGGRFVLAGDLTTGASAGTGQVEGELDLGGAVRVFNIVDGPAAVDVVIGAGISRGAIVKTSSGKLVLSGANLFGGGLALEWGALGLGHDGAAGSGPLVLRTSGTLLSAEGGARRLGNEVHWNGQITLGGESGLELAGVQRLFGQLVLVVSNPGPTVISGPVGESGGSRSLTQIGPGGLGLRGANTFSGGLAVAGGWVSLEHGQAAGLGPLSVSGGGLKLSQGLGGPVRVSGAVLGSGGWVELGLNQPGTNALLSVAGALDWSGGLRVVGGPGFSPGVYRLFDYEGAARVAGLRAESLPPGFTYSLVLSNAGQISLAVSLPSTRLSLTCPSNLTVSCVGEIPPPDPDAVIATSDCVVTEKGFLGDSFATNDCHIVVTRTYRAADSCGNFETCAQLITVIDTTKPTITCPVDLAVPRLADVPSVDLAAVTATDNCGDPVKSHTGDQYATNGCSVTISRTFRATDACGNTETCTQTIAVINADSTPPVLACSGNLEAACAGTNGAPVTFEVTAADDCDPLVTVDCTPASGSFFPVGTNTVRCVAVDAAGNTNHCSFTVTVRDDAGGPPTLSISRQEGSVRLCWPQTCAAYVLEEVSVLHTEIEWIPADGVVTADSDQVCVTLPINGNRFFRLRRQ